MEKARALLIGDPLCWCTFACIYLSLTITPSIKWGSCWKEARIDWKLTFSIGIMGMYLVWIKLPRSLPCRKPLISNFELLLNKNLTKTANRIVSNSVVDRRENNNMFHKRFQFLVRSCHLDVWCTRAKALAPVRINFRLFLTMNLNPVW